MEAESEPFIAALGLARDPSPFPAPCPLEVFSGELHSMTVHVVRNGKDPATGLQRYDIEKQDNTLRWDLSTRLRLLPGDHSPYVGVDVLNVTDSRNIVSNQAGVQLFGVGRQYWLEVGYDF